MLRSFKSIKVQLFFMVFVVLAFMCFVVWSQIYLLYFVLIPINTNSYIYLSIFIPIFILFLWSFLTAILTDPGRVPLYWGFFLDDPEHKKRRYCLICHIFKPERCHHCSICNRCVLNMDHHCPWINNCVGFYNRKFFILMLYYSILVSIYLIIGSIFGIAQLINDEFIEPNSSSYFDETLVIFGFISVIVFLIIISMFFKFHLELLIQNSTTIENLDEKRNPVNKLNFDMGSYFNWAQVMGKNPYLWPFPIFLNSGKPVGDGVLWPQKQKEVQIQN